MVRTSLPFGRDGVKDLSRYMGASLTMIDRHYGHQGTLFVTPSLSVEFESVGQDSVGSASIALRCFSSSGLW